MAQTEHGRDGSGLSISSMFSHQFSVTQLFFLERLAWLDKQRRECEHVLGPQDWRMRLLNKALFSTYRDCVDAGVEDSAKELLARGQTAN